MLVGPGDGGLAGLSCGAPGIGVGAPGVGVGVGDGGLADVLGSMIIRSSLLCLNIIP